MKVNLNCKNDCQDLTLTLIVLLGWKGCICITQRKLNLLLYPASAKMENNLRMLQQPQSIQGY